MSPATANLALASLFLPLSHFLIASTSLRDKLVRRWGERIYTRAYSLLSVAAFVWLGFAYANAPAMALWAPPRWLQPALVPLMLLAGILIVGGLTTPNPVIVRSEALFHRQDVVRGILRITRNPFFWGVSLIAVAHMVLVPTVAAFLAFGSVALLGLAGSVILDAKKARRHGAAWSAFSQCTSDLPFLAIAEGRQRLVAAEIGAWRIVGGVMLGVAALYFH
jgi:uncharacterized membrane protein